MTAPGRRFLSESRRGLLLLLPILIVMALVVFLPPDGKERAEWMQFIGRFHPLAVHLPIALVLLVPILQLAGRSPQFSYLRASCGFLLGLATFAATAAATLGWCLARSGGFSGPLVTQHMWGGSRTSITDRSATAIAGMKRLRVLRLMNTAITDATLQRLSALDQLESLSLFGTQVTSAVLPAVSKLPKLAHLYAGQTSISQGSVVPEGLAGKLVF